MLFNFVLDWTTVMACGSFQLFYEAFCRNNVYVYRWLKQHNTINVFYINKFRFGLWYAQPDRKTVLAKRQGRPHSAFNNIRQGRLLGLSICLNLLLGLVISFYCYCYYHYNFYYPMSLPLLLLLLLLLQLPLLKYY